MDTKLAEIQGQVNVLEERTKLGFWGFIGRAVIIGIFVLATGFAVKYFYLNLWVMLIFFCNICRKHIKTPLDLNIQIITPALDH